MKRILGLSLAICMMIIFCGCGAQTADQSAAGTQATHTIGAEVDLNGIVDAMKKKMEDGFQPKLGIVLGSGFHPLAEEVEVIQTVSYDELPGFPRSTVEGHAGKYILGYLEGVPVMLMDGRVHYYEGYSMEEVVTPVRVMAKLGVDTIILTNAAGSLRMEYPVGSVVCLKDHIATLVPDPLIGHYDPELGERFVGMGDAYDEALREKAHEAADELGMDLLDGVYIQITGPSYETVAESNAYAGMGADVVGMSTACENIALRQMGVKVLGFTCVTDYCPNVVEGTTTHEAVLENAEKASAQIVTLMKLVVKKIGE